VAVVDLDIGKLVRRGLVETPRGEGQDRPAVGADCVAEDLGKHPDDPAALEQHQVDVPLAFFGVEAAGELPAMLSPARESGILRHPETCQRPRTGVRLRLMQHRTVHRAPRFPGQMQR